MKHKYMMCPQCGKNQFVDVLETDIYYIDGTFYREDDLCECSSCHALIPEKEIEQICVYYGSYYQPPEYDDICKMCLAKGEQDYDPDY